jgi:hypothetical protein
VNGAAHDPRVTIGNWRVAYASARTNEGRRIARAKLRELGGAVPTAEDIAIMGGLPVSEEGADGISTPEEELCDDCGGWVCRCKVAP